MFYVNENRETRCKKCNTDLDTEYLNSESIHDIHLGICPRCEKRYIIKLFDDYTIIIQEDIYNMVMQEINNMD